MLPTRLIRAGHRLDAQRGALGWGKGALRRDKGESMAPTQQAPHQRSERQLHPSATATTEASNRGADQHQIHGRRHPPAPPAGSSTGTESGSHHRRR